jgi:hypothetical protein
MTQSQAAGFPLVGQARRFVLNTGDFPYLICHLIHWLVLSMKNEN